MKKKIYEILANREQILMKHIDLDRKSVNDPFLSQFMMGRVEMEESWIDETRKLLSSSLETNDIMQILQNRKAILQSFIQEAKPMFNGIDGQKMRGKTAVNGHWLKETETLLNSLEKE